MGKYTGKKAYGNEQLQELSKKGNEEQGVYFQGQKQNMERTVKGYSCTLCQLKEASHQGFIHASGRESYKP